MRPRASITMSGLIPWMRHWSSTFDWYPRRSKLLKFLLDQAAKKTQSSRHVVFQNFILGPGKSVQLSMRKQITKVSQHIAFAQNCFCYCSWGEASSAFLLPGSWNSLSKWSPRSTNVGREYLLHLMRVPMYGRRIDERTQLAAQSSMEFALTEFGSGKLLKRSYHASMRPFVES